MNNSMAQLTIVMNASARGANVIFKLTRVLPRKILALILFVQHIGAHCSKLSRLVSALGPNLAVTASDGGVLFELNDKRPVRYRCHTG